MGTSTARTWSLLQYNDLRRLLYEVVRSLYCPAGSSGSSTTVQKTSRFIYMRFTAAVLAVCALVATVAAAPITPTQ